MRRCLALAALVSLASTLLCPAQQAVEARSQYAIGADVSFLGQAEQQGGLFRDHGVAKPGLAILHDHGYNWVRLRIFHAPTNLPNDFTYTLAAARKAKTLGFKFLLDFHYADSWADPLKQPIPAAWAGFTHEQLVDAVFAYTRDTVAAFDRAGAMPDMVQVGNEVTNGMLWPDGKVPEHWDRFAELLAAGIRGVRAGSGTHRPPAIMIHIDKAGDIAATRNFFDKLATYKIEFDAIGQSYYPWWQGSLDELRACLDFTIRTYGRDVYLVETAYNWRPGNFSADRPGPLPETPAGQRDFLDAVNRIVRAAPGGHGKGIFWWEPAVRGELARRGFFDERGNALPVVDVFDPR